MNKLFKLSLAVVTMGLLTTGCASKNDTEQIPTKTVSIIKKEEGYIIKPLQYTSAKLITGVKNFEKGNQLPVILQTDNCRMLAYGTANDYSANIEVKTISCEIDGKEFESKDIRAFVMKDNYMGLDLSKKEVEKRTETKSLTEEKANLYGLTPGQEIKIFIESGTLNKL